MIRDRKSKNLEETDEESNVSMTYRRGGIIDLNKNNNNNVSIDINFEL